MTDNCCFHNYLFSVFIICKYTSTNYSSRIIQNFKHDSYRLNIFAADIRDINRAPMQRNNEEYQIHRFHRKSHVNYFEYRRTTASYSEPREPLDKQMVTYARTGDTGGARGGKGLSNKSGTGEKMGCTSGEYSSVARQTMVGRVVIQGSISIFTIVFCSTSWGGESRTARRIGMGLCGREKSGTLIPKKTKHNGIMRVKNRMYLLCFANIFINSTYQILKFNTSRLK